ncbi:mRNA interferase HigB [Azospirillum fermentarium]|uniref:type II toxin-antitoxin system HigB family toxin n=1 Tax=Azospirillum fermentarium TaxID=1233114 RepID=UPI002227D902|nr:type II toxin-antitoxin system HigB family toxin [Azospirillum fermentarium]MCW2249455.1 mRNA interferase HigB [Azospirillum fermentarium]
MRIIAYKMLREHWERPGRADSQEALTQWYAITERADWAGSAQLKDQFRSASFVGDRVVFNIAGNEYRLVVVVKYKWRMVYIRFIGTHAEYDALNHAGRLESI